MTGFSFINGITKLVFGRWLLFDFSDIFTADIGKYMTQAIIAYIRIPTRSWRENMAHTHISDPTYLTQFDFALQHNVKVLTDVADAIQNVVAATVDDASGACEIALRVFGQVRADLRECECKCAGGKQTYVK